MSFPFYDQVLRAFQELQAEGWIAELPPGNQEEVEQQKGLLTRRAAYYANVQDPNYGILEKTTGNNSEGYSVDLIVAKDGTIWDVATDNGRIAIPLNGGPDSSQPHLAARWRQPTRELAKLGEAPPQPEPPPDPVPPPTDNTAKLDAIYALLQGVQGTVNLISARQDTTDAGVNDLKRGVAEIKAKQKQPYSYSNRFIGGITPVGVED